MSLINDALKRAQRQRTGESPPLSAMPGVGGEPAAKIAKRAKPVGFNSLLIRLGLGAGTFLVLVIGGWFTVRALRSSPAPSKVEGSAWKSESPEPITRNQEPAAPATPGTPKPSSVDGFVLPISPAARRPDEPAIALNGAAAGPPPAVSKPVPSSVVRPPASVSPPAKPAGPPAKLEPRAIVYIENLRIAGIRASATDSKVLMNDRVYRVGDTVEHELGLKLTGISSSSLTFEDERGAIYTRQF